MKVDCLCDGRRHKESAWRVHYVNDIVMECQLCQADIRSLIAIPSKSRRNVPTIANERHRFNLLYSMQPYVLVILRKAVEGYARMDFSSTQPIVSCFTLYVTVLK